MAATFDKIASFTPDPESVDKEGFTKIIKEMGETCSFLDLCIYAIAW